MERLKLALLLFSLLAIAICFGAGVWLYVSGFDMLYMVLFFLALVWQCLVLRNYLKQRKG